VSSAPFVIKDQELAELRHNLRTPVNHILGYGEMLAEDADAGGEAALREQLQLLIEDGRRVLAVINDGLSASLGEVAAPQLRRLQAELLALTGGIRQRVQAAGSVLAATRPKDDPAREDLAKVEAAIGRLTSMAENLLDSPAPAPAREAPPAPVSPPASVTRPAAPAVLAESAGAPAAAAASASGHLLIVDDIESNRDVLGRRLEREGYQVTAAADGLQALALLGERSFDLVLLDIMMPGIDGFQVLKRMKSDPTLREVPVIMISALDEIQSVVRCLETGAEDYLTKPFDPVLLRARIGASLERKRLRDAQRAKTAELERAVEETEAQRRVSESLLRNILPVPIADELQSRGAVDPKYFEDVTILFADFVGFTSATENLAAEDLVNVLHTYFSAFDAITAAYQIEKLKTIGDSYMLAGGLPVRSPSHPVDVVLAAFEMVHAVDKLATPETPWKVRIGVHTGPVIAGMVGTKKFAFDIWGESVNFASRMESASQANRINVSSRTYSRVKDFFECESRGRVAIKEGREFEMYFVKGILPKLMAERSGSVPPAFLRRYRIYFQKEPPSFPAFLLDQ
jgi:adenylate cyclase